MVGPEFKVLECSAVCCSFCLLTCVLVAKCECVLERKRLKRKTVSQHLKTCRNEKRNSRFSIEEVLVLGTFFSLFSEKIIPDIYDCCGLRTQWGDRSFRIEASFWILVPWSMIHDPWSESFVFSTTFLIFWKRVRVQQNHLTSRICKCISWAINPQIEIELILSVMKMPFHRSPL